LLGIFSGIEYKQSILNASIVGIISSILLLLYIDNYGYTSIISYYPGFALGFIIKNLVIGAIGALFRGFNK
jgi:hypothetical protein